MALEVHDWIDEWRGGWVVCFMEIGQLADRPLAFGLALLVSMQQ